LRSGGIKGRNHVEGRMLGVEAQEKINATRHPLAKTSLVVEQKSTRRDLVFCPGGLGEKLWGPQGLCV